MRSASSWLLALAAAAVCAGTALAADPPASPAAALPKGHALAHPTWRELTGEQKEALAPLATDWDKFDGERKRKWVEIASKYRNMSPEGQEKLHQRMPQLARLTPEQRETARNNFKRAYALPPDQRQAITQKYQSLPDERKRELAAQAQPKPPRAAQVRKPPAGPGIPPRPAGAPDLVH